MKPAEEMEQDNKGLRERLSRLSEASLLINEGLDFQHGAAGALGSKGPLR